MRHDNVPRKDSELLTFAGNISTRVTATPTAFGATTAIATQLATYYSLFQTSLAAATNPQTRGGATIQIKQTNKTNLVTYLRVVIRQIQGTSFVTNQQRYELGLTIRGPVSPVQAPTAIPQIVVEKVEANVLTLFFRNPATGKRNKPVGVYNISVYSYAGPSAPNDPELMKYEGNTTTCKAVVVFPIALEPFSKVWLSATYNSPRGMSGPGSQPIATNLGSWTVQDVEAENPVKIAA